MAISAGSCAELGKRLPALLTLNHLESVPSMHITGDGDTCGFPPGYFVIRSVATDRLLDVTSDEIEDGTELLLWAEKESSLVEGLSPPTPVEQRALIHSFRSQGSECKQSGLFY
jgi:hypothetical protein